MIAALAAALVLAPTQSWTTIFNGKDLAGWTPKIKGYKLGENFGNTFRVEDGKIVVSYDQYGGKFNGRFGHLFYKGSYGNFMLRLDYRFVGEQLPDGPGWAIRNSGIMVLGQKPETMGIDQDFPVSIEVQLLGGNGKDPRPTANLCTPGTNVVMQGKLITQHTNDSRSATYHGDQWVHAEVQVYKDGRVVHQVNGGTVLTYEQCQYDPTDADAKKLIAGGSLLIKDGSISLQSESSPVEFKNVQLMILK